MHEINPADTLRPSSITEALVERTYELSASVDIVDAAYQHMRDNHDTHKAVHDRLLQSALLGQQLAKQTDYLSDLVEADVASSYRHEAAVFNTQLTPQQIADTTNHVKALQAQTEKLKAQQPQPSQEASRAFQARQQIQQAYTSTAQ